MDCLMMGCNSYTETKKAQAKVRKGAVFAGANRRMDNAGREWRRTERTELSCEVGQVECK